MLIKKNCLACAELISVRLADHKRGWGKFCDKACSAAYKCHQRPRDVTIVHARTSHWAADRMRSRVEQYNGEAPPKAPSVQSQVGTPVHVKRVKRANKSSQANHQNRRSGCHEEYDEQVGQLDEEDGSWDAHKDTF